MSKFVQEGKLELVSSVRETAFEAVPEAFLWMLAGGGIGKRITKILT